MKTKQNEQENKNTVAVNPSTPIVKTEQPAVAESKQSETEKTALANNTTDNTKTNNTKEATKAIEAEKANETKLAVNVAPPQNEPSVATLANEENQISVMKDTLFQSINSLIGKDANIAVAAKTLQAPELPETEMPVIIEEERRRLVFIPPTEVFANVASTLSYYMFAPNKGDQILVNNFSSSSQRLGFAAQLGFVYPIAKRMDLRTGLSFSSGKSSITYGVMDNTQKSITVLNDNSIQINSGKSIKSELRNWQYFELQSDVLYEV
ncbi:MAG: hypothetical protein EOP48_33760, partial [Sphingobacteriales bacterium]